jgi:putative ABC transport system permease protein
MMETGLQLLWGFGLLGIAVAIAAGLRLEEQWQLTLAGLRGLLQLFVFGYLVAMVWALQNPIVSLGAIGLLVLVSAILLRNQLVLRLPMLAWSGLALAVGVLVPLVYGVLLVMQPIAWYDPQVLLPLTAVVLASAATGGLTAANQLIQAFNQNPTPIETQLALGSSVAAVVAPYRQAALRSAIAPNLAALSVVGLGSIPTWMAGNLLGGVDPLKAAALQWVVMLMGIIATLITSVILCNGIQRQFFNDAAQLQRW